MKKNPSSQILSPENYIRQRARNLPLFKCYVNEEWDAEGSIAFMIISREHINGNITFCSYMVDLKCLGIKDTMYKFNMPDFEFDEYVDEVDNTLHLMEIDYNLAHNIIYAAWEFGDEIGFEPHKDFLSITRYMLAEDNDDIPLIEVACGDKEGKPFYIQGPYEDDAMAKMIINRLEKNVGVENFHYILAVDNRMGEDPGDDWDDDDWDDDKYDEMFQDYKDRFREEYSEKSHEERAVLYLELTKSIEEIGQKGEVFDGDVKEEIEEDDILLARIEALADLLYFDMVDTRYLHKWLREWEKELDSYTITNAAFNRMLGLPDSIEVEYEDLSYLTREADEEKLMQYAREKWGELPYIDYLGSQLLDDREEVKESIYRGLEQYPDHALLRLEEITLKIRDEKLEKSDLSFKSVFGKRKEITPYEYQRWQIARLFYFVTNGDLAGLEALMIFFNSEAAPEDAEIERLFPLLYANRISLLREVLMAES